jgi:hypothetical protein
MRLLAPIALLAALTGPAPACADEAAMPVHHIPQVELTPEGRPRHEMAERTARWAAQAGLPLRWTAVPFKRSLEELRRNATPFCVLGVFDLPERRSHARFSRALVPGEPQVLVAATRVAADMQRLRDVRSALLDPRFELLAFEGVAYGEVLDRWIAARTRRPVWIQSGSVPVLSLLARGRADFTISAAAEVASWRAAAGAEAGQVEVLRLPGMPPPPTRHLACSLKVAPAWMARFDAAARAATAQ